MDKLVADHRRFHQIHACLSVLLGSLLLAPAAFGQHYAVSNASTSTNGDGNPSRITEDHAKLTINEGASIVVSSGAAVWLTGKRSHLLVGGGIINRGSLESAAYGIGVQYSSAVGVENYGTVHTAGTGISTGDSEASTLSNHGVVDTRYDVAPALLLFNSTDGTALNYGVLTTAGYRSHGLGIRLGADNVLTNHGSIITTGEDAYGVSADFSPGAVLSNYGEITTQAEFWSDGMSARDSAGSTVYNAGTITVAAAAASGMALYRSPDSTIVNDGTIIFNGLSGSALLAHDESDNATVINNGLVQVATADGIVIAESVDGTTTYNAGVVQTYGDSARGYISEAVSALVNSGSILAASTDATAVAFTAEGGADALTLLAGSRIVGRIDLGDGPDNVVLDRTGDALDWKFTLDNFDPEFDNLSITGGLYSIETLDGGGVTVTVADAPKPLEASLRLAELLGGVRTELFDRLLLSPTLKAGGGQIWTGGFAVSDRDNATTGFMLGGEIPSDDDRMLLGILAGTAQSRSTGQTTDTIYAGAYGHFEFVQQTFADVLVLGGSSDGTVSDRLRANNLVAGGIETVPGFDLASGPFAAVEGRVGAYLPQSYGLLAPSISFGYGQHWVAGSDNADTSVEFGQFAASTLHSRLELAAILGVTDGPGWRVTPRVGVDLALDTSSPVAMAMNNASSTLAGGRKALATGFVGGSIELAGNGFALVAGGEIRNGAGHLGGLATLTLNGRF